ncbi:MAG: hypothetical protein LBS37_05325 [Treponema sp.]|jgi:hypothetical protein|nr:hypothetical protein [Treponema sp.]
MNRLPGLGAGAALCVCLVLAALFSENFTAVRADHDCHGAGCPVCLLIQGARLLTRQSKYAAFPSGLFPGAVPVIVLVSWLAARWPAPASSVVLKVKMNK